MRLMGNCRDVTRSLAENEGPHLNLSLGARLHLLMCRHCRRYRRQLEMISTAAKNTLSGTDDAAAREIRGRILGRKGPE